MVIPGLDGGTSPEIEVIQQVLQGIDGDLAVLPGEEGAEEPPPDYSLVPFGDNLAEYLEDADLNSLAHTLSEQFDEDLASRADWEATAKAGLELLGLDIKETRKGAPFEGASAVIDPIITEAIVRLQSNAILEIFPPNGPVKEKIWGNESADKLKQAKRKEDYMNHVLTTEIASYRNETERLLWDFAFCGSAFRKIYADPETGKPLAKYFPAEDVVIPYGSTDLWSAEHFGLIHRFSKDSLKRMQLAGFYLDHELPGPPQEIRSDLKEAKDKIIKEEPSIRDGRYRVIEVYCRLNLKHFDEEDGLASPYVVTYEESSKKVLAIRRNWEEGDSLKLPKHHVVQYTFIPGPGSYGFGYVHLLGNLAKANTGMLRNLLDASTLENLPGGFIDKSLREIQGEIRLRPFEWKGVTAAGAPLAQSIYQIPYKGPSQTLAAIRTEIRQTIQELASIADPMNGATNGEIPVGTLLAMIQHKMKVLTAVQSRLHASLKQEFAILTRVIREHLASQVEGDPDRDYPYDVVGAERSVKLNDFQDKFTSEPVSDPNMATRSERVMQLQAIIAAAQQAPPGVYDVPALHRELVAILVSPEAADRMVPDKSHIPSMDPATENAMLIMGKPVKAYPFQDHAAHLASVMSFIQDPKRKQDVGQMPQGQQILGMATAHAAEHIAFLERQKIEKELGFPLPPFGEPIPPEVEIGLSKAIAEATRRVFEQDKKEAEFAQKEAAMKDPLVQIEQAKLQIAQFEAQSGAQNAQAKIAADAQAKAAREETERMRIQNQRDATNQKFLLDFSWLRDEMKKTNPQIDEMRARVAKMMSEIGGDNGRLQ